VVTLRHRALDAETDVLPGRTADAAGEWLRSHPGVQAVCRDGSGAYGEAVRRAQPGAVQAGDRWHLWHGLAEAVVLRAVGVPCLAVRWSSGVPGVLMMVVPRARRPVAGLRSKGGERRGLRVHRIA
jgi:hypothetical protein